jgi:hypothetical protein
MSLLEEQHAFYVDQVPEQFNRTLAKQREAAGASEEQARILGEMEAVRTSIIVQIHTVDTLVRHTFDIDRGEMHTVESPSNTPFLILGHALDHFPNLRRECGDSLLGFLGGLAGLGDDMLLTSQRVRSLRELDGSLVLERVGVGGFSLFAHFGNGVIGAAPRSTIRLESEIYAQLRTGEIDVQDAFLAGSIEIEGDEGMAINLALAALSPD